MPQARKQTSSRARSADQETYRAELTSSQLVLGICILMLFGLACFLVGLVVGRFDPTPAPAQIASAQTAQPTKTIRLAPPEPEPEPEPAPLVVAPEPAATSTTEPEPAAVPQADPATPVEPESIAERPTGLSNTNIPEPEPETPDERGESPEHTEEPANVPVTADPQTSVPPAIVEPLEPEFENESPAPVNPESSVPADGQFTVQIGAFSRQENALLAKKRIESATKLPVYLVDTPGGGLIKVHAGVFGSTADAQSAQTDLRERLGYGDTIVTRHSIAFTQASDN